MEADRETQSVKYSVNSVFRRLRSLILEDYFPPEKALPPIHDLAAEFGVGPNTVQAAVHRLREAGMVVSKRGQGVFVKYPLKWNSHGRRVALLSWFSRDFIASEPYPAKAIAELRQPLNVHGYDLEYYTLKEIGMQDLPSYLDTQKLAGVVLLEIERGRWVEEIQDLGLPLVSMDFDLYRLGVPSVVFDNFKAGCQAARHLIEHGHEQIAYVRKTLPRLRIRARGVEGRLGTISSVDDDRKRGYQWAMEEADLSCSWIEEEEPLAREHLLELYAKKSAPTALICEGDGLAAEMIKRLEDLGYLIPADISVLGFGATGARFNNDRTVTSIWMDHGGMGRHAAKLLLNTLEGKAPQRIILPTRVEVRDSTAILSTQEADRASHAGDPQSQMVVHKGRPTP